MTEAQMFEKLGRKQGLIEAQDEAYSAILNLLAQVVIGAVEPSRIMVNMTARTWELAPEGFRPQMPATVNGLPLCIVAPSPKNGAWAAARENAPGETAVEN